MLTYEDYPSVDNAGWTLQLDNRKEDIKIGQSSTWISLLDPGIYKLRVRRNAEAGAGGRGVCRRREMRGGQ